MMITILNYSLHLSILAKCSASHGNKSKKRTFGKTKSITQDKIRGCTDEKVYSNVIDHGAFIGNAPIVDAKGSVSVSRPSTSISRPASTPKVSTLKVSTPKASVKSSSSKSKSSISNTVKSAVVSKGIAEDCDYEDMLEGDDDCEGIFDDDEDQKQEINEEVDEDAAVIILIVFAVSIITIIAFVLYEWYEQRQRRKRRGSWY